MLPAKQESNRDQRIGREKNVSKTMHQVPENDDELVGDWGELIVGKKANLVADPVHRTNGYDDDERVGAWGELISGTESVVLIRATSSKPEEMDDDELDNHYWGRNSAVPTPKQQNTMEF